VWRDGMANWQLLRQARPAGSPSPTAPPSTAPSVVGGTGAPGDIVCAECGHIFTRDNAIQYGTSWVCATCKPVFLQKLREGTQSTGEAQFAGFWIRFAAKFIDGLVMAVILAIPIVIVVMALLRNTTPGQPPNVGQLLLQIGIQLVATLFGVAYNTFMVGKYGATLGKMAVGIRVVTPEGQPISYLRAFGRAWADLLSGMVCYIGYIIVAFDGEKRALHDHICSTRVVYKAR
jgi:uncharacterized RDD family membrane protein YckC